jgi:hypothetical protein
MDRTTTPGTDRTTKIATDTTEVRVTYNADFIAKVVIRPSNGNGGGIELPNNLQAVVDAARMIAPATGVPVAAEPDVPPAAQAALQEAMKPERETAPKKVAAKKATPKATTEGDKRPYTRLTPELEQHIIDVWPQAGKVPALTDNLIQTYPELELKQATVRGWVERLKKQGKIT